MILVVLEKIGKWCLREERMINAIIPARGGSKGIPKKNIIKIGNHPLIAYSIKAAQLCQTIDRIIVSTDDEEIANISLKYGAEVPFIRPAEYATDSSSDLGFLKHYFENIGGNEVALLRPTTPFRDPCFMDRVIKDYFDNPMMTEITGLRTAEQMGQPIYKMFEIDNNGYFKKIFCDFNGIIDYTNLPRQGFPKAYNPNGHIDIVKRNTIAMGSVFGDKIAACISEKVVDIDDSHDVKIACLIVGSDLDYLSKHMKEIK